MRFATRAHSYLEEMNTKPPIKLIKKEDRKDLEIQTQVASAAGPNGWSNAVHSWVVESQQRDRSESLPAFNSLFKDALLQIGRRGPEPGPARNEKFRREESEEGLGLLAS
jgi:hypothetical protein